MMFKTPAPDVESAPDQVLSENLIPLSHFELDHPQPPEGWPAFLGRRAIAFVSDDIGRDSIRRSDAQKLLYEKRANEVRVVKLRQLQEQEAVEQDELRRSQIWKGLSVDYMPPGVAPAAVMLQAHKDSQPRRQSVMQHALSNEDALEFHPYAEMDAS